MSEKESADLNTVVPPAELSDLERLTIFQHFFRRLAAHRNQFELYALAETGYIQQEGRTGPQKAVLKELDHWAQQLLKDAFVACHEPGGGSSYSPIVCACIDLHCRTMS
jgi:hypothetical protein